jgi:hypothetical protein
MPSPCPLCTRPAISDAAFWHGGPVPPGACPQQGGSNCSDHAEERVRLMGRVVEAARRVTACTRVHERPCWDRLVSLDAALRALDGEGG